MLKCKRLPEYTNTHPHETSIMSSPIEGNVGIVTFVAEHDYEPQDEGEIDLRKGDLIVVAKPIIDPCGWLTGTNKRTGDYGQIPGTFVSIVEDYTPPPPPRPPKPVNLTKTTMMIGNQADISCKIILINTFSYDLIIYITNYL